MGKIADKLALLLDTKERIKEAIKAKGVGVDDADTFSSYAEKVQSIRISAPVKDVNLFDYDGTILYSYTQEEFLNLTELPPITHSNGLNASWCNSLEEAKGYVEEYGIWDIGVTYDTDDKETSELHYTIGESDDKEVQLYIYGRGNIDWGDGNNEYYDSYDESTNGYKRILVTHTYGKAGNYVIRIKLRFMGLYLGQNCSSNHMLRLAVIYVYDYQLYIANCSALEMLMLKGNPTNSIYIRDCHKLKTFIVPSKTGSIFNICDCSSIEYISGLLSHSLFYGAYPSLRRCVSNTTFGYAGYSRLQQISLPKTLTKIPVFTGCTQLPELDYPEGCTSIEQSAFSGCRSLREFTLPTGITRIEKNTFQDCVSLRHLVVPKSVTSIGNQAFYNCIGLVYLDFRDAQAVPALGYDALSKVSISANEPKFSDCKIIVPDALYDEWIAATNWSTYASQIVKASEYNG